MGLLRQARRIISNSLVTDSQHLLQYDLPSDGAASQLFAKIVCAIPDFPPANVFRKITRKVFKQVPCGPPNYVPQFVVRLLKSFHLDEIGLFGYKHVLVEENCEESVAVSSAFSSADYCALMIASGNPVARALTFIRSLHNSSDYSSVLLKRFEQIFQQAAETSQAVIFLSLIT